MVNWSCVGRIELSRVVMVEWSGAVLVELSRVEL